MSCGSNKWKPPVTSDPETDRALTDFADQFLGPDATVNGSVRELAAVCAIQSLSLIPNEFKTALVAPFGLWNHFDRMGQPVAWVENTGPGQMFVGFTIWFEAPTLLALEIVSGQGTPSSVITQGSNDGTTWETPVTTFVGRQSPAASALYEGGFYGSDYIGALGAPPDTWSFMLANAVVDRPWSAAVIGNRWQIIGGTSSSTVECTPYKYWKYTLIVEPDSLVVLEKAHFMRSFE